MLTWLFIIVTTSIICYQRYKEGRWMNLLSLMMTPYLIIVGLNNLLVHKLGFYLISDDVLLMLTLTFIVFFLGTLPFRFKMYKFSDEKNRQLLSTYNIKYIKIFLYTVGVLGIIRAVWFLRHGVLIGEDAEEGVMGNGPIAHLLLASYSVLPIYFLYWTYTKGFKNFIPIILIFLVAFSSFIKYNVIGPIIIVFIFIGLYRTTLVKKYLLIFPIIVLFFFIANYAIGFAIIGAEVEPSFYIAHFWKYFAGSLIYDNYIFTSGVRVGISLSYKIMGYLFALPNMVLNKLFGSNFFEKPANDMRDISSLGEQSNVVDAIGALYPSKGDFGEIICFYIIIFILGLTISYIYIRSGNNRKSYSPFIAIFLTYYIFLNFFSSFFSLNGPWEILVWSLIIPPLFKKNNKLIAKITNLLRTLSHKALSLQ